MTTSAELFQGSLSPFVSMQAPLHHKLLPLRDVVIRIIVTKQNVLFNNNIFGFGFRRRYVGNFNLRVNHKSHCSVAVDLVMLFFITLYNVAEITLSSCGGDFLQESCFDSMSGHIQSLKGLTGYARTGASNSDKNHNVITTIVGLQPFNCFSWLVSLISWKWMSICKGILMKLYAHAPV